MISSKTMIELVERQSEPVAANSAGSTYSTGYDHIDATVVRQSESPLHQQAVEAFQRTSIISLLAHSEKEGLCCQGTTLLYDCPLISFGNLPDNRTEQANYLYESLTEQAQQSEATLIAHGNQLSVVLLL